MCLCHPLQIITSHLPGIDHTVPPKHLKPNAAPVPPEPDLSPNEMSSGHAPEPKNFEPKQPVRLDPPKNDPISLEQLSQCDGELSDIP